MALMPCGSAADPHGRELVSHGTALFPAACYRDDLYLEDVPCPWHWHDELEAVVVSQGEVLVSAGRETFLVPAGEGFFINTRVLHNVRNQHSQGFRLHSIVFHPRLVGGSLDSVFWQEYLLPLMSSQAPGYIRLDSAAPWSRDVLSAIEAAWQSAAQEPPGFHFQIRSSLSQLVFQLVSHLPAKPGPPSEKALRDEARVKDMMRFVQAHYTQELSYFIKTFRELMGRTPAAYREQKRKSPD